MVESEFSGDLKLVETAKSLEEIKESVRLELAEMREMLKNIQLAQESTTGYKFSCSGLPICRYCASKPLNFVCLTVKEAQEHSMLNSVAMFIHKD